MEIRSINELKELYADSRGFDSYNDFLKNAGYPTDESWEAICKAYAEQFINYIATDIFNKAMTVDKHYFKKEILKLKELIK